MKKQKNSQKKLKSKLSKLALAVTFGIALTFTFSCSGGDDDLSIKHEDDDKTYKDFADKNFSVSKYEKAMSEIYSSMYPKNSEHRQVMMNTLLCEKVK